MSGYSAGVTKCECSGNKGWMLGHERRPGYMDVVVTDLHLVVDSFFRKRIG
jgi:hypothetical protein